jgi:hypothetical protein
MRIARKWVLGVLLTVMALNAMSVFADATQWEYAQYHFFGYDLDKSNLKWQLHHIWSAPEQNLNASQLNLMLEEAGINFSSRCLTHSAKGLMGKPYTTIDCEQEEGAERYVPEIMPLKIQTLAVFGATGWELVNTTHTDGMAWGTIIKDQNEIYYFKRKKN